MAQDPALQLLELRAGIDSELLHEQLAGRPASGERVGLPPRAVERECVLRANVLPVRLGRDQPLELGHELVVAAKLELGVVEEFDGAKSMLLELSRLRLVDWLAGQISKRFGASQIERDQASRWMPEPSPCRAMSASPSARRSPCTYT